MRAAYMLYGAAKQAHDKERPNSRPALLFPGRISGSNVSALDRSRIRIATGRCHGHLFALQAARFAKGIWGH
jgi:hypothetical protein